METNLLWTGRLYHSLENCLVEETESGVKITSTIIGTYLDKIYKVAYLIETNRDWQTTLLEISYRHSNSSRSIRLQGDGQGNWRSENGREERFFGCLDVDIALTPFTNSLPVNRLHLADTASCEIQVVYCDLLENSIRPVKQRYTRLLATRYHYENVPNDFEATIEVDEAGFVVDYPSLFVRTASVIANYRL